MTDRIDKILEWIKKANYRYEMNNIIHTVVDVCDLRIFIARLDKELSIHNLVEDKILPKDCNKCIHESVCKMLDYIHKDNFKLGLLISRFFEIYTDSNLADKCVKYKEEVIKEND